MSIITLYVSGLNAPTKRHTLAECIQQQDPHIRCLQETHFRPKDTYRLKMRRWKNRFHENGKQKKAGVAILISDEIDLKIKKIIEIKTVSPSNTLDQPGLVPGTLPWLESNEALASPLAWRPDFPGAPREAH